VSSRKRNELIKLASYTRGFEDEVKALYNSDQAPEVFALVASHETLRQTLLFILAHSFAMEVMRQNEFDLFVEQTTKMMGGKNEP